MRQAYLSQAQLVTVLPSCINDSLLIFSEYLILRLKRGCMTEEQLSDIIVINRRWVGGATCHLLLWCSCVVAFCKGYVCFYLFIFPPSVCVQRVGLLTCHFTSGPPALPGSLYLHLHRRTFACAQHNEKKKITAAYDKQGRLKRTPVDTLERSYQWYRQFECRTAKAQGK